MKSIIISVIACLISLGIGWTQDPSIEYPYEFKANGNPLIKYMRTADPSCHVWPDGRLWMYPSHDPDNAGNNYDGMDGYHVYSTVDMVNWVDHGEVLHSRDVEWNGTGSMWAPDCAHKNGKYYFYFPSKINGTNFRTGVAISDKPEGPFIAEPDFIQGTTGIDPMCFIDDDGQAYLYFGYTGSPFVAKLKDNMIELAEEMRRINIGTDPNAYVEGSFMHKHKGKYYLSWSNYKGWEWNGKKYGALYAIGDSPYGPFTFMGGIKENPPGAQDHHSIVSYHGKNYIFYHTGNYNGGNSWKRNVCVDYLYYNEDGSIQVVPAYNSAGVQIDSVGLVDALLVPGKHKADTFYKASGISGNTTSIVSINNGDEVEYVIDVLGTDPYELNLKLDEVAYPTTIKVAVDNDSVSEIKLEVSQSLATTNFKLMKGRHLLKLTFESAETSANLLVVDSLQLSSGYNYYSIEAIEKQGGKISPSGVKYYKEGSDAVYTFTASSGYLLDSVMVDGISHGKVTEYTFSSISEQHTLEAFFSSCNTDVLFQVQIDDSTFEAPSELNVEFESAVTLLAQTEAGIYQWTGPSVSSSAQQVTFKADDKHIGNYKLRFTNDAGCSSEHQLKLQVILTAYQAEDFLGQDGVKVENCGDIFGGKQLGYIQNGDWSTYNVNLPEKGAYEFKCRVAAPSTGEIKIYSGSVLAGSTKVEPTGSWNSWGTTKAGIVNLPAGNQTIKLVYTGGSGYLYNINWFKLNYSGPVGISDEMGVVNKVVVYPNPASDELHIYLSNWADVNAVLFSPEGKQVLQKRIDSDNSVIDVGDLPSGMYFLKVGNDDATELLKVVIYRE